ncbi:MAG: flagellar filament capping protein FliD, partial [Firmicutes bacterium]|nr:flagellar filament capping protein FliD [Bacillota bacterium]
QEEIGVTAALIDGRLVLTRVETGGTEIAVESNELSIALGLETVQEAQDAIVKLNGLEVTRSTNVFEDLLEGVTFKLLQAGDNKPLTITVTDNHRPLIGKIEEFIRHYNSTYQFVKSQIAVDLKSGSRGRLYGESSLNQVLVAIRRTANGIVGEAGSYNCLSAIGISTAKWDSAEPEGNLVLDQGKLKEILEKEPGSVTALLSNENGVAGRLENYLGNLTRQGEGLIHSRSVGIENRIKDLDRRVEALESRLEKRELTLRQQFLAVERIIGEMNSQGQWLDQQLSLMTRWTGPNAR